MLQTNSSGVVWRRHAGRRVGGRRRAAADRRGLRLRAVQHECVKSKSERVESSARDARLAFLQKAAASLAAVGLVSSSCYLQGLHIVCVCPEGLTYNVARQKHTEQT